MTALLQDEADVVTDEDIAAALREVSAIVGVRIQNALRGRGDDVTTSAPAVGTAAGLSDLTQGCLPVGFRDASGEVRFTTFLRTLRRETAAPVMPQACAS